jgi:bacterial leucyl aminopeptidase
VPTVFFDLGGTLGTPLFSPMDDHLEGFEVYPEAREALEQVRTHDLRMGIVSDAGPEPAARINSALEQCGIYGFFDPTLIILGLTQRRL